MEKVKQRLANFLASPVTRLVWLFMLCAVLSFAQGPLVAPITAVQAYALTFAKLISAVAIVYGALQVAFGNHRAMGLAECIFGVGLMGYAQQVVTWLFP